MTETAQKMSIREWLCTQTDVTTGLPLARPGKGRFSRAAQAAVAAAYAQGMEFTDDDPKPEKVSRAKRVVSGEVASIARVKAPEREYDLKDVRDWAEKMNLPIAKRGRISGEILAQYDANNPVTAKAVKVVAEKPRVRPESVAYGLSAADPEKPFIQRHSIAFETCGGCSNKIGWCSCADGPRCPNWMNGGEVASLTKL